MQRLKSIKLYFFSILNHFFLSFRNYYFSSNYYNKKLITFVPDRIFYKPSTYLANSLTTTSSDFYNEFGYPIFVLHSILILHLCMYLILLMVLLLNHNNEYIQPYR